MSLKDDAFPSSEAFDAISAALSSDAERKDAVKQGGAIFAFSLKNADGKTADWHVDLKESGKVGKGKAPQGKKPDAHARELEKSLTKSPVTLVLSESDFGNLVGGKGNAQMMFMQGKLKIKGNVMKATKLDPILKKAQTKAKL